LLYEEQGKLAEAQQAYEKEIEYYPNHFRARFNLGKILLARGDFDGYMKQMEKVIEFAPEEAEGYLFMLGENFFARTIPRTSSS